ncbi:MAG: hypothetical protein DDT32_02145 [Syntrophomonadaceae bacterium]|nr:hypothetical protein [Bacillota bacterium]MBT9148373.1 hypothetical protein [Bacillota bacterium]
MKSYDVGNRFYCLNIFVRRLHTDAKRGIRLDLFAEVVKVTKPLKEQSLLGAGSGDAKRFVTEVPEQDPAVLSMDTNDRFQIGIEVVLISDRGRFPVFNLFQGYSAEVRETVPAVEKYRDSFQVVMFSYF